MIDNKDAPKPPFGLFVLFLAISAIWAAELWLIGGTIDWFISMVSGLAPGLFVGRNWK